MTTPLILDQLWLESIHVGINDQQYALFNELAKSIDHELPGHQYVVRCADTWDTWLIKEPQLLANQFAIDVRQDLTLDQVWDWCKQQDITTIESIEYNSFWHQWIITLADEINNTIPIRIQLKRHFRRHFNR